MKRRFQLVPDVHLLLEREGRLLFLERQNTGYADGLLGLVAGHLEGAETAREALCREAYEEVGLSLHPVDLELVHVSHRRHTTEFGRQGASLALPAEPSGASTRKVSGRSAVDGSVVLPSPERSAANGREPERLGLFFRTRRWPGEPVNAEPDRCAALHWHPWQRLPGTVIPYLAECLRAIRTGARYSEWGW